MNGPKQGVQLKQTQTLAVTPQLQQRLKILQCNQQDLMLEIGQMLDKNIMLEFQTEEFGAISLDDYRDDYADEPSHLDDLPQSLDIDSDWDDVYDDEFAMRTGDGDSEGFQDDWVADSVSFDSQIEESIFLSSLEESDKQIALWVLTQLDENYFLSDSVAHLAKQLKIPEKELLKIIDVIKHLDPAGVASQSINECMLAQLHQLGDNSDTAVNAHEILSEYFDYLSEKPQLIKQRLGLSDDEFEAALMLIRGLSPYPRSENKTVSGQIKPDVFVRERMGMFYASGHEDPRFDLGINEAYAEMVKQCSGDEKHFMQSQLQEAKFFLKALDERQKTVLRVANAIVMHQQDYFVEGEKAMQPLTMATIAEMLDLNESTISRTVNGKYVSFNQRLIELRSFFSQDLSDKVDFSDLEVGQEQIASSATSVKAAIKEMIDNEDKSKPLSDSKIEKLLSEQGVNIARRTVTKYRESLGIAKTSERKRRK